MVKYLSLYLFLFFSFFVSYGQTKGDYYVSISMDGVQDRRLKFLSDTTVEVSSIPRHISPFLQTVCKYELTDTTIEIFPNTIVNRAVQPPGTYVPLSSLETKFTLTKIAGGFIDYNKSLIYVRQRDFPANPDITYVIDGKSYTQHTVVKDRHALLKKGPKKNKALQNRLKTIGKDNCTIEIVRGVAAYERFGIDKVYGVIIITTKK